MEDTGSPRLDVLGLIEAWDGNGVVVRHHSPTGAWIFIALHNSHLGPPAGGTRMKVYGSPAEGLEDAQRLAEGMTFKWAGLDLPHGGGKAVLALERPLSEAEQEDLWQAYGELVESLGGAFVTGADLGMSAESMARVARYTRHVLGVDYEAGVSRDPGPYTARGVFVGIEAALAQVYGAPGVAGRRVLVEGLGGVGGPLARALAEDGADLVVTDLDADKARRVASELGVEVVELEGASREVCDVYAPCAVGAILSEDTIPHLGCRIVAGSANNQLRTPEDAARLAERGILYVPDYIINAGGAMAFVLIHNGLDDLGEVMRRVGDIGASVTALLEDAEASDAEPLAMARERVLRRLAATRR